MKIEVPALKIERSSGSNRKPVRQQSILVAEDLQGAGILRLGRSWAVAPSHENYHFVRGIDAYLVPVDPDLERRRGLYLRTNGPVRLDPMHRHAARIVVSQQHMRAGDVR